MPSETFAPNSVWSSTTPTGHEEELTTPSGQTCRARKMSIESMIAAGLLAESDAITAQIAKHMAAPKARKKAKGPTPPKSTSTEVDVPSLMKDSKAVSDMVGMIDKIMPHIVVSPVVRLHYMSKTVGKTTVTKMIPEDEREPGMVYTDQIGLEDKMFLFDWSAGGLGAMLAFRE